MELSRSSPCARQCTSYLILIPKSEIGWDDFRAQKYRAWEHHLALTALSLWFVAQTKLEWTQRYARDPELARLDGSRGLASALHCQCA